MVSYSLDDDNNGIGRKKIAGMDGNIAMSTCAIISFPPKKMVGTFFRASIALKQRSEVTNSFDNDMTMMLAMGRENNKRSLAMAVVCPPWSTAVQKYWSTQQTPFHHLATT
jgi:hypothetical protein